MRSLLHDNKRGVRAGAMVGDAHSGESWRCADANPPRAASLRARTPAPSMAAARQIPEANVEADPQANRPRNDASQSLATPLGFAANWFIQCVFAGVALPDRSMARAIS